MTNLQFDDRDPLVMFDPDPARVLVCGDWHGDSHWVDLCCETASRTGADTIVQVGDFGFWVPGDRTDYFLNRVERGAQDYGLTIYWLDGNHEDHSRRGEFNDPVDRPSTIYLPRGTRWTWWGRRFMAVGGAHSVDRRIRKANIDWWDEEHLSDGEVEYASRDDGTPVDVVFAHDCPSGVDIPGIGPDSKHGSANGWPADALYEADIHRNKLRKIWGETRPRLWFHGHYHIPYELEWEGTRFIGLGSNGDVLARTVRGLSPLDL